MTAVRLKIGHGWIFLNRIERDGMNLILTALEKSGKRDLLMEDFVKLTGRSYVSVSHLLFILVAIGVLRVRQISRARIFNRSANFQEKLKERIVYYE